MRFDWSTRVCSHSTIKCVNDVSNMVGSLQVVRIYSFIIEIKGPTCASYIIFPFVKTENNFIKEMKNVLRVFLV